VVGPFEALPNEIIGTKLGDNLRGDLLSNEERYFAKKSRNLENAFYGHASVLIKLYYNCTFCIDRKSE
jgi:hypothetical protein